MNAQKFRRVTMHDLADGDLVTCAAGIFRISNRRVSFGHRAYNRAHPITQAELDAPENDTDVIVFDAIAVDPEQSIQTWRLQGNHLATVGLYGR